MSGGQSDLSALGIGPCELAVVLEEDLGYLVASASGTASPAMSIAMTAGVLAASGWFR